MRFGAAPRRGYCDRPRGSDEAWCTQKIQKYFERLNGAENNNKKAKPAAAAAGAPARA